CVLLLWLHFSPSLCRLINCSITEEGCAALASALKKNPSSHLRELNLRSNKPGDSGVKKLSDLLEDPHCKLEKLDRVCVLSYCSITEEGCAALASALRSNPSSHLREMNLNYNKPEDSGVKKLSELLEDPHCKLEKLDNNKPEDSGVKKLSDLLEDPHCTLETLV
uniref:Uncharacterized protein n=1 Tax=Electrophorus electricus TaxID=8005 RepID=A0A4W4E1X8_ELEEL